MAAQAPPTRLGDWLLDQGHISQTQLDLAIREQKRGSRLLGEVLSDLGFVSQATLSKFLARKTESEAIQVRNLDVPSPILALIPQDLARRFCALPISRERDVLTVAISDPLNVTAFDLLEQASGLRVNLVAAAESDILQAIDRLYQSRQSVEEIVEELLRIDGAELASTTEEDPPTIRLADRIITEAVTSGASDIHIHPEEKILRIRLRRDGVLDGGYLVPKPLQAALIARFKILGGMDIAESRRTQDGRSSAVVGGREIGLRFSILPTAHGESLVLRILDRGNVDLSLQSLGFDPELEQKFRGLIERPHGVILVTGPTGSGKTTSLYTALGLIDGGENSIFTLEDPVEYQLPLVRQTQINEDIGLTFADGLRTLLRQDPDVILVGETRDTETAQLVIRAALTGHLVFSTLHTNDAISAIPRLVDLGVAPYLLAPTLVGVLGQRLVRKLCPNCRAPHPDSARLLETLHLPEAVTDVSQLSRPVGCQECRSVGFRGRIGVHELLVVDAPIRAALTAHKDFTEFYPLARKGGFRSMLEDGVRKAARGQTTVEEVLRVVGG